jgi:hypothetical protein
MAQTLFTRKVLVWFEGDWWLSDNPEQEIGQIDWYIDLPQLPEPSENGEEI